MSDDASNVEKFEPGTILFREKDGSGHVYIIKEGQVAVIKKGTEGDIPIAVVGSGEFLGEMSLINDKTRSTTAMALTPVKAAKITKQVFLAQYKKTPPIIQALVKGLVDRLERTDELIKRNNIVDEKVSTSIHAIKEKYGLNVSEHPDDDEEGAA